MSLLKPRAVTLLQRIQKLQKGGLERLETIAEAGDIDAQIAAALSWEKRLVRGAKARAFKWWQRAAESGDAGAQYQVSWYYRDGVGVEQSDERALRWIRRAAAQSHSDAEYSLGWMYSNGKCVAQNKSTAARWYLRAAGHGSVEGMFNAAYFLERGIGTRKNWSRATALYRRAAQLGDQDAKQNLKLMVGTGGEASDRRSRK
jgi:TPR repeat protein